MLDTETFELIRNLAFILGVFVLGIRLALTDDLDCALPSSNSNLWLTFRDRIFWILFIGLFTVALACEILRYYQISGKIL